MGKPLFLDGVKISGGADVVHLTWAQYNALPDSKNSDGKIYCIDDVPSGMQTVANGVFVDTDNVIVNENYSTATDTYTATEDCYVMADVIVTNNTVGTVDIDGKKVCEYYYTNSGISVVSYSGYLKKGQTILVTHGATSAHSFIVYGIQKGTDSAYPQVTHNYSTNEKVVGTWIDGSTLYEKTIELNNIIFDNQWHTVPHGVSNIDKVISCIGILFGEDGEFFNVPQYRANTSQGVTFGVQGDYIAYINNWYNTASKIYATIQYTKSSS